MEMKNMETAMTVEAEEQGIVCPDCGTRNPSGKFCRTCGKRLEEPVAEAPAFAPAEEEPAAEVPAFALAAEEPAAEVPAFAPATEEPVAETPAFAPAAAEEIAEVEPEMKPVFAEGLPEWTIEPPQMMIRRR